LEGLLCVYWRWIMRVSAPGIAHQQKKTNIYVGFWVFFCFCFFFLSQEMNRMRCSDEWCHFLHYHICLFSFLFFFHMEMFQHKNKGKKQT
jgi:hypothetical protein